MLILRRLPDYDIFTIPYYRSIDFADGEAYNGYDYVTQSAL